jgi:hypothetical protein
MPKMSLDEAEEMLRKKSKEGEANYHKAKKKVKKLYLEGVAMGKVPSKSRALDRKARKAWDTGKPTKDEGPTGLPKKRPKTLLGKLEDIESGNY